MFLYKCVSDPNALVPNYTDKYPESEIITTPYEPLDDLNGYVILDYNESYNDYNKAELYGKYYTITSRVKDIGHKIRLNLTVDVMKTYENELKSCEVIVSRTSGVPESDTATIGWNALLKDLRSVQQINDDVFEVGFTGLGSDPMTGEPLIAQSEFGFDGRPYLLAIGCDPPDEKANAIMERNLNTNATGQQGG